MNSASLFRGFASFAALALIACAPGKKENSENAALGLESKNAPQRAAELIDAESTHATLQDVPSALYKLERTSLAFAVESSSAGVVRGELSYALAEPGTLEHTRDVTRLEGLSYPRESYFSVSLPVFLPLQANYLAMDAFDAKYKTTRFRVEYNARSRNSVPQGSVSFANSASSSEALNVFYVIDPKNERKTPGGRSYYILENAQEGATIVAWFVRVGSNSLAKFLVKGKSSETAFEYVLSVEGRRSESAPTPGAIIDERTYTEDQAAVQSAHQDLNAFLSGPYARAPESERREMELKRIALNRALKEKIERVLSRYAHPFDIRDSSGRVTRSPGLSVEQRETYRLLLEDCERQIRESEGVIAEMPVAPPSSIEDLQRVRDDLDRSSEVFEAMRVFMDQYSAKYPSASPSERAELKQRGRALLADGRRANENLRVSAKKLGDARILDLVDNQDQYYSRCSEYLSY